MIKTALRIRGTITVVVLFIFVAALLLASRSTASANGAFVTTWKTDQVSATNRTITIPTASTSTYNYSVDWGDGTSEDSLTGSASHTYDTPGSYQVSIRGTFPRIMMGTSAQPELLQSVDAWGSIAWESMVDAFLGASNLQVLATDSPDLSDVDSLSGMFRNARSLNSPLGGWDLGNVSSIVGMFEGASSFNQDISAWDTSRVQMFAFVFRDATAFDQNLNAWDMTRALSTNGMFAGATSFDSPLNDWEFTRLKDMRNMFHNAISFDQDVSSWNTTSAERMENLFRNAVSFRQDISNWDFRYTKNAESMFSGTRLSGPNYDRLLIALSESDTLDGVVFDAGSSTYCVAESARALLVDQRGWTLHDNGRDTSSCADQDIQFTTGVAAAVAENAATPTILGTLVTYPDSGQGFTYSFCDPELDSGLFTLTNGVLSTNTSFDFENPLDQDQDNVYELCVRSVGPGGFDLQRVLTVAVIDDANEPDPSPDDTQGDADQSSDPQVLASSTDEQSSDVLAAEDEQSSGEALAASGVAILLGIFTGAAIVLTTTVLSRKSQTSQKIKRTSL